MEWNNTPPAVYARVNTLKTGSKALLAQWREEGVECSAVRRDWLEENAVFELGAHPPLHTLPSFQRGWFYLQDPGTLLAVRELNPQPGETVLDFCAAPGGKATYIAQLMQNQGRLIAQDTDARRMKLLEENSARLGWPSLTGAARLPRRSPRLPRPDSRGRPLLQYRSAATPGGGALAHSAAGNRAAANPPGQSAPARGGAP